MAFQVTNGSIPERVERWLMHHVFYLRDQGEREWTLEFTDDSGDLRDEWFGVAHDRKPTLQEAIEAVMAEHMGFERAAR